MYFMVKEIYVLNRLISSGLILVLLGVFSIFSQSASAEISAEKNVCMYFFYSKDCSHCITTLNNYLPELERKYSNLEIQKFEFNYNSTNLELRYFLERKYNQRGYNFPFIIIDKRVFDRETIEKGDAEKVINNCTSRGGCECPLEKPVIENVSIPENASLGERVEVNAKVKGDFVFFYALISKPRGGEERIDLDRGNKFTADYEGEFTADYEGEYKIKLIAESIGYNATYTKSMFVKAPEKPFPIINYFNITPEIPGFCLYPCFERIEINVSTSNTSEVYGLFYKESTLIYNFSFELVFSGGEYKIYSNKANKITITEPGNYSLILLALNGNGNFSVEKKFKVNLKENKKNKTPIKIHYFTTKCSECDRASEVIELLKNKYGAEVVEYDVTNISNAVILLQCAKYHNKTKECGGLDVSCWLDYINYNAENKVPIVIAGENFLLGREIISDLELKLENCSKSGLCAGDLQCRNGTICSPLPLPLIVISGLIDGINPCAFAVLIFFISYLIAVGRDTKTIIIAGVSYVAAVFAAYLAMGLVLLSVISALQDISDKISFCIGLFALFIGFFSFYEAYITRGGKSEESKIKMPDKLRKIANKLIRERVRSRNLIIATAVIGFMVAAFELPCTGLIYLVVITAMHTCSMTEALPYFILYNILFILPLVIIFIAVYKGTTSERLGKFVKENTTIMKLLTGIILVAMGIYILM